MSAAPLPRPAIERRQGFAPLPNHCLWDWARLASGDAQVMSILFINSELHLPTSKRPANPKWTNPISNEEFAAFCRCTVRAIETAFKDLLERKVIVRRKALGGYAYGIPFETWPGLPDRPSKVVVLNTEVEPAPEETSDEAAKTRGHAIPVHDKRQTVKAGGRTRPVEFKGAIPGKMQVRSQFAFEYDAYIQDGTLVFMALSVEQTAKGKENTKTQSVAFSDEQPHKNQLSNFHLFETAWLENGVNAGPEDWAGARAAWSRLDTAKQLAAVAGIHERFQAGQYNLREARYIPLPQNYLQNEHWLRPVGRKSAKAFKDEATVRRSLQWAEDEDRKMKAGEK